MSRSAQSLKNRAYPLRHFGYIHMSNDSAITINPIESQRSICICDGMLCAVRMASHPIVFKRSSWRSSAARLTAAPSIPGSWCRHTPFIFRVTPLSWNPPCAVHETVLNPMRRVTLSRVLRVPSGSTAQSVAVRLYRLGVSGVHGVMRPTVCIVSAVPSGATGTV